MKDKEIERVTGYINVLDAYRDGKTIEVKSMGLGSSNRWEDLTAPASFNFGFDRYRVKPEQREFWIKVTSSGHPVDSCVDYDSFDLDIDEKDFKIIKVREVIDDNIDNDSYEVTNKMKGIGG